MPLIELHYKIEGVEHSEQILLPAGKMPREGGMAILEAFNYSLRPGELARKYFYALEIDGTKHNHEWKKASLVTERGGFDKYRCENCGAMGKRHGLQDTVRPDKGVKEFCKPRK